jgi:hypothetical protein
VQRSTYSQLIQMHMDFGFWILDFADARTVRVPRQFSAPSRILDSISAHRWFDILPIASLSHRKRVLVPRRYANDSWSGRSTRPARGFLFLVHRSPLTELNCFSSTAVVFSPGFPDYSADSSCPEVPLS